MDDLTRAMLLALGPGGTRELAERALAFYEAELGALKPAPVRLGGLTEVAAELGVSRQTLGHWIAGRRGPGTFPEPLVQLSATPVWDLDAVTVWGDLEGLVRPSEEAPGGSQ